MEGIEQERIARGGKRKVDKGREEEGKTMRRRKRKVMSIKGGMRKVRTVRGREKGGKGIEGRDVEITDDEEREDEGKDEERKQEEGKGDEGRDVEGRSGEGRRRASNIQYLWLSCPACSLGRNRRENGPGIGLHKRLMHRPQTRLCTRPKGSCV